MKDILQKLKELRTARLVSRVKHLRGRHDQRDHNRWPAGYQAQTYVPTGRRAGAMAARVTGGIAGMTQTNLMMNQTKRIAPKVKTGEPSMFAPMPIDASEIMPGGQIYEIARQYYPSMMGAIKAKAGLDQSRPFTSNFRQAFMNLYSESIRVDGERKKPWIEAIENIAMQSEWMFDENKYTTESSDAKHTPAKSIARMFNDHNNYIKQIKSLQKKIDDTQSERSVINQKLKEKYGKDIVESNEVWEYITAAKEYEKHINNELDMADDSDMSMSNQVRRAMGVPSVNRGKQLFAYMQESRSRLMEKFSSTFENEEDANNFFSLLNEEAHLNLQQENDISDLGYATKSMQVNFDGLKKHLKYAKGNTGIFEISSKIRKLQKNNVFRFLLPKNPMDRQSEADISSLLFTESFDYLAAQQKEFIDTMRELTDEIEKIGIDILSGENASGQYAEGIDDIVNQLNSGIDELQVIIKDAIQKYEETKRDFVPENLTETDVNMVMNMFFGSTSKDSRVSAFTIQRALAYLYDIQSYNGKPKVVGFDEILNPTTDVQKDADGTPLVYWRTIRGVSNTDTEQKDRGMEYVEDMRTGETHFPGTGVSGFGTYMKTSNINSVNLSNTTDASPAERITRIEKHKDRSEELMSQISDLLNDVDIPIPEYMKSDFNSRVEKFKTDVEAAIELLMDKTYSPRMFVESIAGIIMPSLYGATERDLSSLMTYDIIRELQNAYPVVTRGAIVGTPDIDYEKSDKIIKLKKIASELADNLIAMASDKASYQTNQSRLANLQATRDLYGDYSAGYTINSDARIPPGYVNKYNPGNSNHSAIASIDDEINMEFKRRYPQLEGAFIDTGIKMTMLGYDMYYAHLNNYSTNIVLLNRAILNMSDETIGKDSSPESIQAILSGKN